MKRGQLTCGALVQGYLDRIAAYDQAGPKLNSIQTVNPDALKQAAALDAKYRQSKKMAPLHCVPVLVKDQLETTNMPTTYGSAMFKTFVPARNATIVEKLVAADAIILAKTNLGEFAALGSGSAFGDCQNAYRIGYAPSGSSCGTGTAVAANLGLVGIGEDTAGSIRGPASHESLVGLRPTLPLVSRFGAMPQGPSRDTLGPMTRTVKDTALVLDVIAGYDPKDPVTAESVGKVPLTYSAAMTPSALKGVRVGLIRQPMATETDVKSAGYLEVRAKVNDAVSDIEAKGAAVVEMPEIADLMKLLAGSGSMSSTYETEQATNAYLAEHPGSPIKSYKEIIESPLLNETRRKMMQPDAGHTMDEPAFLKQLQTRQVLRTAVLKAMADAKVDVIMYATFDYAPVPMPRGTPGSNRLLSTFTGYPAVTLPAGYSAQGLPIGIELSGRPFDEATLLKVAYGYEQASKRRLPPSTAPELASR
ncbi:amidase family protein [soil metagenome]